MRSFPLTHINPFLSIIVLVMAGSLPANATETAGRAVAVTGKVLVRGEKDSVSQVKHLRVGDTITQGSVINTASDSTVKLLMTDRTILDLGASTLFKVDEYALKAGSNRRVQVSMDYGKLRASVNRPVSPLGKFNVKTKAATMGVRGTEFIVRSTLSDSSSTPQPQGPTTSGRGLATVDPSTQSSTPNGQTQITVIHGRVAVASPTSTTGVTQSPVMLNGGSQLMTQITSSGESIVRVEPPKVTQLSQQELASVKQAAKPQDITFIQAVAIDTSSRGSQNPNDDGPKRGPGAATLTALSQTLASAGTPQIEVRPPMGVPGTFGADFGMTGPLNPKPANTVRVSVKFINN